MLGLAVPGPEDTPGPILDWEESQKTVTDGQPSEDTRPHETLAFAAGREAGWSECAMAYGEAIEADILASGGTVEDAKRIRRWFDLKVSRQG